MRANGISAQNTTDNALMIASAQRFKPDGAVVVARNVFDPVDELRSFTSLLHHFSPGRRPSLEDLAASALGRLRGGLAASLLWRSLALRRPRGR
jgi:hypothetical protein